MIKKINQLKVRDLAKICDHTFLMPTQAYKHTGNAIKGRHNAFKQFLQNSLKINPYALCVRAQDVHNTVLFLQQNNSKMRVAATVGFPDGSWHTTKYKIMQTKQALQDGASQIDMVINYTQKQINKIMKDIQSVNNQLKNIRKSAILKVILQVSQLPEKNHQQKLFQYIDICSKLNVDFIKTSTGFSRSGANPDDAFFMRKNFKNGVKISGGVTINNVYELLNAVSGRNDGMIELDPLKIRIGQSSLLK